VNPSFGAMGDLKVISGGVFLTGEVRGQRHSDQTRQWISEVEDFIRKATDRIWRTDTPDGVCFLGSHSPEQYLGERWFYILPNPYVEQSWTQFTVKEDDLGISMEYTKKDRVVQSRLLNNLPQYVYSPASLKKICGTNEFMLISNFPFPGVEDVEPTYHTHRPWFLDDYPPMTKCSVEGYLLDWRVKNNKVYDVRGPGTYLSRRARIRLPPGYSWVLPQHSGPFAYSRFTITPQPNANVRIENFRESEYTIYGENVQVVSGRKVDDRRLLASPMKGSREEITHEGRTMYSVISTDQKVGESYYVLAGRDVVIPDTLVRMDAVTYYADPTASVPHPGFLPGRFDKLPAFLTRDQRGLVTNVIHRDQSFRDSNFDKRIAFVGGDVGRLSVEEVREGLSTCGEVHKVWAGTIERFDGMALTSRESIVEVPCFFVDFRNEDSTGEAIRRYDGKMLLGRRLHVRYANRARFPITLFCDHSVFHRYLIQHMMDSSSWSLTPTMERENISLVGAKSKTLSEDVLTMLITHRVSSFFDFGLTPLLINRDIVNISAKQISILCQMSGSILLWHKADTWIQNQYVAIQMVCFSFEGIKKEGYLDGRVVSEVIYEILSGAREYAFRATPYQTTMHFIDLMRLNGCFIVLLWLKDKSEVEILIRR